MIWFIGLSIFLWANLSTSRKKNIRKQLVELSNIFLSIVRTSTYYVISAQWRQPVQNHFHLYFLVVFACHITLILFSNSETFVHQSKRITNYISCNQGDLAEIISHYHCYRDFTCLHVKFNSIFRRSFQLEPLWFGFPKFLWELGTSSWTISIIATQIFNEFDN